MLVNAQLVKFLMKFLNEVSPSKTWKVNAERPVKNGFGGSDIEDDTALRHVVNLLIFKVFIFLHIFNYFMIKDLPLPSHSFSLGTTPYFPNDPRNEPPLRLLLLQQVTEMQDAMVEDFENMILRHSTLVHTTNLCALTRKVRIQMWRMMFSRI